MYRKIISKDLLQLKIIKTLIKIYNRQIVTIKIIMLQHCLKLINLNKKIILFQLLTKDNQVLIVIVMMLIIM